MVSRYAVVLRCCKDSGCGFVANGRRHVNKQNQQRDAPSLEHHVPYFLDSPESEKTTQEGMWWHATMDKLLSPYVSMAFRFCCIISTANRGKTCHVICSMSGDRTSCTVLYCI